MEDCIDLPPGFRFHPTDEEIITHYLSPKVVDRDFVARAIGEVDLNKCEPWDLPGKAKMGGKEMYFFCQRDRKYPTGMRTNRATESGYWKATGKDKEIYRGKGVFVGMKKTLVFYKGRAPKGEKTNWVMHEFRLEGKHSLPKSAKDEWAVCRVIHKNLGLKRTPAQPSAMQSIDAIKGDHELAEYYPPLPALTEPHQFIDLKANYYLPPTMMSTQNQQAIMMNQMITSSNLPHNSFLQQAAVLPPHTAASYSSLLGSSNNPNSGGYLHHQDQALLRSQAAGANYNDGSLIRKQPHCKVEQYSSNQSVGGCPSQDTALSTDRNTTTDISSVISSGNYDNFDDAWTSYVF